MHEGPHCTIISNPEAARHLTPSPHHRTSTSTSTNSTNSTNSTALISRDV
jgi:hypothetical protein